MLRPRTELHRTATLSTKSKYMDCISWEVTEIELHPNIMNTEDSFYLSKSWKPLICSLKDRRKPPSWQQIAGPCTLPLSGHKICPLWALTSLHLDVLASFRCLCSLTSHHTPATHLLDNPPFHASSLPNTLLHFFCLLPRPAKPSLFRAILNSYSCLLLVYLVVTWESSSFILFHGQANGNWGSIFHCWATQCNIPEHRTLHMRMVLSDSQCSAQDTLQNALTRRKCNVFTVGRWCDAWCSDHVIQGLCIVRSKFNSIIFMPLCFFFSIPHLRNTALN
jgi:hypothetical protein